MPVEIQGGGVGDRLVQASVRALAGLQRAQPARTARAMSTWRPRCSTTSSRRISRGSAASDQPAWRRPAKSRVTASSQTWHGLPDLLDSLVPSVVNELPLASARHPRPAAPRPAHQRHRPLQLPLRVLHAAGGLRPGPRFPAAAELLTFEEITRLVASSRASGSRRCASPAASRWSGASCRAGGHLAAIPGVRGPDPHHQRRPAPRACRALGRPGSIGSPSASTPMTTPPSCA